MKTVLAILGIVGLVLTLLPSFFYLAGSMDDKAVAIWMSAGMILWFACRIPGIRTR
jgi:hypothetical protein